ncbi:MAG: LLM class flavin-dependent oxidoreductase [Thaumarchaeota archaeon]|nr:LLM class flavin-dependent oxidoreductase [Nitrososphaerota archaeon]
MRAGLMLTDTTAPDAIYCAQRAEKFGLEGVWVPEMTRRDSVSILGAIAATTSMIKIAPSILNVYSRTPALVSMTLQTLQELSNGRLICGLSVGNPTYVTNIHGMEVKKSVQRLRETVQIIRKVSAGGPINHEDKIFPIKNWNPSFPSLKPFPIYVGAHNPSLLRLVGELCDGVILNLVDTEDVRNASKVIRDSAEKHGRDPHKIEVASIMMVALDDDRSVAEKRVRQQIAYYLLRSQLIRKRLSESRHSEEMRGIEASLNTGRLDTVASSLSREFVDSLSIYGNKEELQRKLLDYEKVGLSMPIFYVAGWLGDGRAFTDNLLKHLE